MDQVTSGSSVPGGTDDIMELIEIRHLLWGPTIRDDVFRRWSQGFEFSEYEPSALVQRYGGPCGVIAPVQAHIVKIILNSPEFNIFLLTHDKCELLLIQALCDILTKCSFQNYRIVALDVDKYNYFERLDDQSQFHNSLAVKRLYSIAEVQIFFLQHIYMLREKFCVLTFLYSVFLTRGLNNVLTDLSEPYETLIDGNSGYSSQAIVNLMLTGRAVANVWDNERVIGGLRLSGINEQSDIGFLTIMEKMRLCTVGSFYKNPKNPVWVTASETHYTVLFSFEKRLVSLETRFGVARRIFGTYDLNGNNFIESDLLENILTDLELESDPEYVTFMRGKLDPDESGIILLEQFMKEFFPTEKIEYGPDTFDLKHYNGMPASNYRNQVLYNKGLAVILESDLPMYKPSDPLLTCLQTKWPNIDVTWSSEIPSLN